MSLTIPARGEIDRSCLQNIFIRRIDEIGVMDTPVRRRRRSFGLPLLHQLIQCRSFQLLLLNCLFTSSFV